MWFRCANGNYRPLANDSNVMLMYVKNPNSSYIHLYATKNKDEFWHEPLFIEVVPTVIEPFKDQNMRLKSTSKRIIP